MLTWIVYDIEENADRTKVAKACQKAGIYRVQKSVFLGELNNAQRKELSLKIENLINPDKDSVYIFPMNREEFDQCLLLGQAFDKELVSDEIKALFL